MNKELLPSRNKCNGCYACASKCPGGSILMKNDNEGFWYPEIDEKNCTECGLCKKTCPLISQEYKGKKSNVAFAVINKEDETRKRSSSGGVFYLLAENVINSGGVVFGAAFTSDFKGVEHIPVDDVEKLPLLMGSKYLQSKIGDAYKQTKQYLDMGKKVLFSGTPCQIGGLYAYLGKEYETLVTQDIICHGVPSPMVWSEYAEYRESEAKSKVKEISFRHKSSGWENFSLRFVFENGKEHVQTIREDLYMRGFLGDLYLRPSCYDCAFKSADRVADITLADFWGIEKVCAEMGDDNGVSLVLVNTDKGKNMFDSIKSGVKFCEVEKGDALKYNVAAEKCPKIPANRTRFMQDLLNTSFPKVMKKYCGIKFKTKIKSIIKKIAHLI